MNCRRVSALLFALTAPALLASCFRLTSSTPASDCTTVDVGELRPAARSFFQDDTVGFEVAVEGVEPEDCRLRDEATTVFQIIEEPVRGAGHLLARPSGRFATTLRVDSPGTYRVRVKYRDITREATVTAIPLEVPAEPAPEVVLLGTECGDIALHRDHLLCVLNGVEVLTSTAGVVARTDEPVPASYGIAANEEIFATAAYGCGARPDCGGSDIPCCEGDESFPGGIRIYTLDENFQPQLLSFVETGIADDLVLTRDRLYVSHEPSVLEVFDISDPRNPRSLGCGGEDLQYFGAPAVAGELVLVASYRRFLTYRASDLERGCTSPADELARVEVDSNLIGYHAVLTRGTFAYVAANDVVSVFSIEDPAALVETQSLGVPGIISAAISENILYVAGRDRLISIELRDDGTFGTARLVRLGLRQDGVRSMTIDGGRIYLGSEAAGG